MSLTTYCYNVSGAMSTFSGMAFTRIWRVGPRIFGVTSSGVFEITGNTDNGAVFNSQITTTPNYLGRFNLKHLPSARIESLGSGIITAFLDGDSSISSAEFKMSQRVKFGKGLKGRTLVLDFQSITEGFELHSVELYEQELQRGVK